MKSVHISQSLKEIQRENRREPVFVSLSYVCNFLFPQECVWWWGRGRQGEFGCIRLRMNSGLPLIQERVDRRHKGKLEVKMKVWGNTHFTVKSYFETMLNSWNYTWVEVIVLYWGILNKNINRIIIRKYTLLSPTANEHRATAHCSFSKNTCQIIMTML